MKNVKKAGGNMNELFKINVYFEENGEEIEKLISHLLINNLKKQHFNCLSSSMERRNNA